MYNSGMKIALFGGSFDPVHSEHVALASAAKETLGLDRLIVIPSATAPHKLSGAVASAQDRLELCRIAFRDLNAEISPYEIERNDTSYSYLTCERFRAQYPDDELYFLVGADMLENFPTWRYPERILNCVTLVAGGRGENGAERAAATIFQKYRKRVVLLPFTGKPVSSTEIRVKLAFGKKPVELDEAVYRDLKEKGIYSHPAILPALALEKPERREHSYRVAVMAAEHASAAGADREKAILAAALHDCGKYVPLSSPLLKGFRIPAEVPQNVPPSVLHQYTGAYLAEHEFGIRDIDILNAIRFHTSGRKNMSQLEKLILIADMLESGRDFEGIGELRRAFDADIDEGLRACLARQLRYLRDKNFSVYPLTERAYEWIARQK